MLRIQGISKNFGGVQAVSDVSLEVKKQEIIGLIGPNGAGKTTLFNMISRFIPQDQGEIHSFAGNLSTTPPQQIAKLGILRTFQTPIGFQKMSLLENMMVVPEHVGEGVFSTFFKRKALLQKEKENYEKAIYLLDQFSLYDKRNELVENLSAAEMRLLEMCRQMMADPKLLLLDEPASGVNPIMLDKMTEHIMRLREEGMSFLIIDHNLGFIMNISDRIYALAGGKLIAADTPGEIAQNEKVKSVYLGEGRNEAS